MVEHCGRVPPTTFLNDLKEKGRRGEFIEGKKIVYDPEKRRLPQKGGVWNRRVF